MTYGLRIRDRVTGLVTLDVTDRITRALGMHTITTVNGSINVPALATGQPWWFLYNQGYQIGTSPGVTISVSGTTLSWENASPPENLLYGVF